MNEAMQVGSVDEHEQVTIANTTGADLEAKEVFAITNDSGQTVPYIAREDIASLASGEANIRGEFDVAKNSTSVFAVGDDVYWHASANNAVERSEAKTGDFYLGQCQKVAASGKSFVFVLIGKDNSTAAVPSVSSSISVSVSSSSLSIVAE